MSEHSSNHDAASRIKEEQPISLGLSFSDYWHVFQKTWWLTIALCVLFAGFTYVKAVRNYTPRYECSATFTVQTRESLQGSDVYSYSYYYNTSTASQLADTFPYLLQSNLLQDAVAEDLGLSNVPGTISASAITNTNLFTLMVTGYDPQTIYDVLLSVMEQYPVVADFVIGDTRLDILNYPTVPDEPVNRFAYRRDTFVAAAAGFVLGLVIIALLAFLRDTISSRDDIRKVLNRECLGIMPKVGFRKRRRNQKVNVVHFLNKKTGASFQESVRTLRTAVVGALPENAKVILVTSTAPGEGKTTVAQNLASSMGVMGKRVLLLDADLRIPSVAVSMRLTGKESLGLKEVLEGTLKLEDAIVQSDWYHICLLAGSVPARSALRILQPEKMEQILQQLRRWFDYIIIDSPPCGMAADAAVLAAQADAAVLVIHQDRVRVSAIQSAIEGLHDSGVKLIGCVLNNATVAGGGYGKYGYGKYGKYGARYGGYGSYGKYGKSGRYGSRYEYGAERKTRKSTKED